MPGSIDLKFTSIDPNKIDTTKVKTNEAGELQFLGSSEILKKDDAYQKNLQEQLNTDNSEIAAIEEQLGIVGTTQEKETLEVDLGEENKELLQKIQADAESNYSNLFITSFTNESGESEEIVLRHSADGEFHWEPVATKEQFIADLKEYYTTNYEFNKEEELAFTAQKHELQQQLAGLKDATQESIPQGGIMEDTAKAVSEIMTGVSQFLGGMKKEQWKHIPDSIKGLIVGFAPMIQGLFNTAGGILGIDLGSFNENFSKFATFTGIGLEKRGKYTVNIPENYETLATEGTFKIDEGIFADNILNDEVLLKAELGVSELIDEKSVNKALQNNDKKGFGDEIRTVFGEIQTNFGFTIPQDVLAADIALHTIGPGMSEKATAARGPVFEASDTYRGPTITIDGKKMIAHPNWTVGVAQRMHHLSDKGYANLDEYMIGEGLKTDGEDMKYLDPAKYLPESFIS